MRPAKKQAQSVTQCVDFRPAAAKVLPAITAMLAKPSPFANSVPQREAPLVRGIARTQLQHFYFSSSSRTDG